MPQARVGGRINARDQGLISAHQKAEELAVDGLGSSAFMACVRLVADGVEGQAIASAIALGPLQPLAVRQLAIYLPEIPKGGMAKPALALVGQYCAPSIPPAPGSLSLDLVHPVSQAFLTQETIDESAKHIAQRFPLVSGLVHTTATDTADSRVLALPIPFQGVPQGVLLLNVQQLQESWRWSEVEIVQGVIALLTVWVRLRTLTDALTAAGILGGPQAGADVELTERQAVVLELLAEGKSNSGIAASLGFSVSTIKQDIRGLQVLLGARNRREVVQRAIMVGLLPGA